MAEEGLKSKKFIAYLIAEFTWKIIVGLGIYSVYYGKLTVGWLALLSLVILVAAFIEVGYILGQASLDKYLRLAKIATDSGNSAQLAKNIQIGGSNDKSDTKKTHSTSGENETTS
jgi:hypothetical protein